MTQTHLLSRRSQTEATASDRFEPRRLVLAGVVTVVASVIATVAIRALSVAVIAVPAAFAPLHLSSVVSLTIIGAGAAAASCLVFNQLFKRPVSSFLHIAPVVLALSFIPDFAIWAGHSNGASASTVIPLLVMHVAVGLICMSVLPLLGAEPESLARALRRPAR
jgi:hypothetical protein